MNLGYGSDTIAQHRCRMIHCKMLKYLYIYHFSVVVLTKPVMIWEKSRDSWVHRGLEPTAEAESKSTRLTPQYTCGSTM